MFRVENADFIADKLASELLPNQEFREVLKNALEAVERRMLADPRTDGGRIEFDVDWSIHAKTGRWKVSCADNGDGMTRSEVEKYTTTLAVQGAGRGQSLRGNQGMGLKISGPTRHKAGVLIRSYKKGQRTMVQVGWDGHEYGLIPIGQSDELVIPASADYFPKLVNDQGSGTIVTFFGSEENENTFVPPGRSRGWLFKYLNTRFFRLSQDGVEVIVRVPSGDEDEWPHTVEEASDRMAKRGGRSFNLTLVKGTGQIWDDAADYQGSEWRGTSILPGEFGVPPAKIHWWVLPTEGTDVSSRTASGGSLAVLFQNELHDWRTSGQSNPFFARLGILFGKNRICFVIEPQGTTISSDFARAHVLVDGVPIFESDSWLVWADQFRAQLPERIKQTMAEELSRLETEDPDRAKRIRDRLRDVLQLLRPRRFRRNEKGKLRARPPEVAGSGPGVGSILEISTDGPPRTQRRPSVRGLGAVLSELDEAGELSIETTQLQQLDAKWVNENEADTFPILRGDNTGLRDRAAALAGADGRTASILLLNREFRGYQAILAAINDWANAEGDDEKATKIEAITQEWVEQKMIEAVEGLRQLENGKTWINKHYDEALSPVALTAAFMADRYHTLAEVKRAAGVLRQAAPVRLTR